VFRRMALNRVLGAVQRLENAMKKRSAEWALRNSEKMLKLKYADKAVAQPFHDEFMRSC